MGRAILFVLGSLLLFEGFKVIARKWITPQKGQAYESWFQSSSQRWGLPPGLLSKVADIESDYNPRAFNSASGASGIMQLVPKWHPEVDPYDAQEAIDYAAKYLREMRDRFGSWSLALAAYNAGPSNVDKYHGIPPFNETLAYVAEIKRDTGIA